jgi:pimeloyl-ACP methyl ester carboxylesterase
MRHLRHKQTFVEWPTRCFDENIWLHGNTDIRVVKTRNIRGFGDSGQCRLGAASVVIPALIITCHFDPLTPVEGGEELAQRFKNSKHVIVPEMSHTPFDLPNEQDDFLSVLDDFFD